MGGAVTGYRTWASVYTASSQLVYYCATDGTNWEVGQGSYLLPSGALSRTRIFASSNGGAIVNFPGPSLQVFNTWPARATNQVFTINVCDFGAVGNNANDDAAAISSAIAAANVFTGLAGSQRGVRVYFPSGIYLIGSALTALSGNGIVLYGEGRGATTINVNFASGDVINLGAGTAFNEVHDLQFNANVTRASGAFINTNGANDVQIYNFAMTGAFVGISVSSSSIKVTIENGEINSTVATTGVSILVVNGSAGDTYIGPRIIMSNSSGARPLAGVRIQQTGHTQITGCNVTNCVSGLQIDPQANQDVTYVWCTDTLWDSCGSQALLINPANAATARVRSVRFQSSWFSGTASGPGVNATSAGASAIVDDIMFENCRFLNNNTHGFTLAFGTNFHIVDSTIAGNSQAGAQANDGINVAAGITDFQILNNRIGPVGTATNTQRYGILITSGASDRFQIINNDLRGNGNGSGTGGAFANGATGKLWAVGNNLGGPLGGLAIVASSAAINTTETVIATAPAGSNGMNAGTTFRMRLAGTCTSTVANLSTFTVRLGTAGTTADSAIATFTCTSAVSGTNAPFHVDMLLTLRSNGATGTVSGEWIVTSAAATGISSTNPLTAQAATVSSANTTLNDLIISVTYKSAATTTTSTFIQAVIECVKAA